MIIIFEIETKELKISDELNRKIEMICRFTCVKYEFIPGNRFKNKIRRKRKLVNSSKKYNKRVK